MKKATILFVFGLAVASSEAANFREAIGRFVSRRAPDETTPVSCERFLNVVKMQERLAQLFGQFTEPQKKEFVSLPAGAALPTWVSAEFRTLTDNCAREGRILAENGIDLTMVRQYCPQVAMQVEDEIMPRIRQMLKEYNSLVDARFFY